MAPRGGWELGSLRKQAVGAPAKRDSSGDDTWALATGYRFRDFMLHRVARRAAVTRGRFFDFMLHSCNICCAGVCMDGPPILYSKCGEPFRTQWIAVRPTSEYHEVLRASAGLVVISHCFQSIREERIASPKTGQYQSLAFSRQARQESGTHWLDMWAAGQRTAPPADTVGAVLLAHRAEAN